MKRVAALAAIAGGCFGAGPTPTTTTDVTIVYETAPVDDPCNDSVDITSFAVAGDHGYLIELPYTPPEACGGGNGVQYGMTVTQFDTSGDATSGTSIGEAGATSSSDQEQSYVTTTPGGTPLWMFHAGTGGQSQAYTITVGSGSGSNLTLMTTPLVGVVADGSAVYAATTVGAPSQFDALPFPTLDDVDTMSQGMSLYAIPYDATGVSSPQTLIQSPNMGVACAAMPDCMVLNTSSLVFMGSPTGTGVASIIAAAKVSGGSAGAEQTTLATIPEGSDIELAPFGLAADDVHAAWTVSAAPQQNDTPGPLACQVWAMELSGAAPTTPLFQSANFSCAGAALDDTSVYFAIISYDGRNVMQGDGIGRVSLADGTFESISVGRSAEGAGPRRVYLDGDDLYAVDPLVVGKLPKTALAGQHAFQ